MSSGIKLDDDCKTQFDLLKKSHKIKTLICRINDAKNRIIVEATFEEHTFEQLVELITTTYKDTPLYIVHDLCFEDCEKGKQEKVAFINWCTDDMKIGKKMVHSASASTVKDAFGLSKVLEVHSKDELDKDEIIKAFK